MKGKLLLVTLGCILAVAACKKGGASGADYPGTEEGAKALVSEFLKPGADRVALTMALMPGRADYEAILTTGDLAKKAEQEYAALWDVVKKQPIGPKEGQTEMRVWLTKTEDLKAHAGNADRFPGGYGRVADKLRPGLLVGCWDYVRPGEDLGMAYDGLYFVNHHWVLMPKPWRVFGQ
jgi:hypothetical protein